MQMINGFACKDCTDIDYARKHIDPAHPKDGPYGINAQPRPGDPKAADRPAVILDGALAGAPSSQSVLPRSRFEPGRQLDLTA